MSGGSWDYLYSRIEDGALRLLSDRNLLRRTFGAHLQKIAKALHDVEWNDSGDGASTEEESIRACLDVGAVLREATRSAERALEELEQALREARARSKEGRGTSDG